MSSARAGQRRGVALLVRAFDVCVVATTIRVERAWFERSISATTRALVREVVFAVEGEVVLREGIVGACSAAAVLYATATEQQRRGREREQLGGEPSHAPQSSATKSGVPARGRRRADTFHSFIAPWTPVRDRVQVQRHSWKVCNASARRPIGAVMYASASSRRSLASTAVLLLSCSACHWFPGSKPVAAPPCGASHEDPALKYAYPTDSGINKECTIARPNQEVQLEQDADGRHCVDLQTVAYMGFKPKQIEMDNRYMLVTDGGESATFEMETLEIEKVGMCFGSSDPVDIWLWQRRGCVEAPADVDTSSTLALRWIPKLTGPRELARWDFTGRVIEPDLMRTDPVCEQPEA